MVQVRNKIRTLRELKGYSQEYMAEKMDISQKTYSRIESGNVKLDVERLQTISELLDVAPSALLDNDTNTFNYYNKVKHSGNIYITDEEYIEHLNKEIDYLKGQIENLMKLLGK